MKLALRILVLWFAIASTAMAQTVAKQLGNITNGIPAATGAVPFTNTPPATHFFSCENWKEIGFGFNFKLAGAGNSNVVLYLDKSMDKTNYFSFDVITVPGNGTTFTGWATNYNTGGIPFFRVRQVVNQNTVVLTNLSVWLGTKRGF